MSRFLITVKGPEGVKRYSVPANELARFEVPESDVEGQSEEERPDTREPVFHCTMVWDTGRRYAGP